MLVIFFWLGVLLFGKPVVLRALAAGEVKEVGDDAEVLICQLLALLLDEAQGYLTNERRPAAVGAPGAEDAVAER